MKILITGGAGFIGSHLAERLISQGHRVSIWDNFSSGSLDNVPRGAFWQNVDCRFLTCHAPDVDFIYHCASTVGVKRVLSDPAECINNIIDSTQSVLSLGIPGMYFSTSEVYGRNTATLYEESDIVLTSKARWSYAAAKLTGEWLAKSHGWKVVRPFNVVGPRQSSHYGAVLPKFVQQAAAGKPITVFGDGSQVRTFLNVRDACEIFDRLRDETFDVVNVGGLTALPIYNLALLVKEILNSDSSIQMVPYEKAYEGEFEECDIRVPDLVRLQGLLGTFNYRSLKDTILQIKEYQNVRSKETIPT